MSAVAGAFDDDPLGGGLLVCRQRRNKVAANDGIGAYANASASWIVLCSTYRREKGPGRRAERQVERLHTKK